MNPDNSNLQGKLKKVRVIEGFELSRVKLVRKLPGGESKKVRVSRRFELLRVRVIEGSSYRDSTVHIKIYMFISRSHIYIETMTGLHVNEEHFTGLPGYPAPNQNVGFVRGFDTAFRELF